MNKEGPAGLRISRGLDLPISGAPVMQVEKGPSVRQVALLGADNPGMKPTLLVAEGDRVALGQAVFSDKQHPEMLYTAPAAGRVVAINRGDRRVFLSMVIALEGDEEATFPATAADQLPHLAAEDIEGRLLEAGLWPAFRTRPYSRVPAPQTRPAALFVTAMDTNPLAPDPRIAIAARTEEFRAGLTLLKPLTSGRIHLCTGPDLRLEVPPGIDVRVFAGCHPAGLVGTHIHFLERVDQQRCVWHIGYQDVIAIGHLFLHGRMLTERIVALAGPAVRRPRLIRSRLGACLTELVDDQLHEGENRVISGSVLSGRTAAAPEDFLGRYHHQVSVLAEDRQRRLLGWLMPGSDRFSVKRIFAASLLRRRQLPLSTSTHGSVRAMVPTGAFERVMPLNIQATWLLRALLTRDTDLAQDLGCLELDEEDLALCSFVCSGKIDYGYHLRQVLQKIEVEG
ncbi:MAG: Na(+)-translocating NADH-quinone reductase subunit A [Pelovirga sp.]